MNKQLLLPNKYRLAGYCILPFGLAWLIATSFLNQTVFSFLKITARQKPDVVHSIENPNFLLSPGFSADLNLTFAMVITLVGLLMIAFSREKREDEYVSMVRLRALQVSVYVNYVVLIVSCILFYDLGFLMVMEFNLFTIPVLFILVYNYLLNIKPRLNKA